MTAMFSSDLSGRATGLLHFWEHTVGSGHASLALRADWQAQLKQAHDDLGMQHVRFHGILGDDMGTLAREGDTFFYSFFNTDQIFDFLLSIGRKPFVELSFMPTALSSGDQTVFHYRANVSPPSDYAQWAVLIRKLVYHWVDRYGLGEVRQWFFEVWNEPNLTAFGNGTQSDYFELYRYTVEAIKGVDKLLKVGGPATAANAWINEMAVVMSAGLGMKALAEVAHTYPAKSEAIMLAAQACKREFDKAAHQAASRRAANET